MYNPRSVLENKTYKHLLGFEIQTDHLILARRPYPVIDKKKKKKKKILNSGFSRPGIPQNENKRK